jgi:DNA polymerase-3 subunit epsilon
MAQHADAIVAWGAEFDRGFVQVAFGGPVLRQGQPIPWVCAMNHVAWPRPSSSRKLTQVVLAHDLGVSHAHRAAVDVDMVARVLTRARELGCNLEILLEDSLKESQRPRGRVVALVNYEDREKAKSAGFRWDKEKQEWWRVMPLDEAPALGFPVRLPPEQGNAA